MFIETNFMNTCFSSNYEWTTITKATTCCWKNSGLSMKFIESQGYSIIAKMSEFFIHKFILDSGYNHYSV